MTELETQVAKIQISGSKQANAYIHVVAEKIAETNSELYVICELPMFNPAAETDCERICQALAATLRRSYKRRASNNTFEEALANINEELGKLSEIGKAHWIGKLNSLVAVKTGTALSISTVGKVIALLLRDDEAVNIAESGEQSHPLKTFENFSVGKLKLDDTLIFSTATLFNYLSLERIKRLVNKYDLQDAATEIIDIMNDNAGPEVAFGTIIASQVEPGMAPDQEVDLIGTIEATDLNESISITEKTIDDLPKTSSKAHAKIGEFFKTGWETGAAGIKALAKNPPKPSFKGLAKTNRAAIGVITDQFRSVRNQLHPERVHSFSRQKKFFLGCAVILLVALAANIIITQRYKNSQTSLSLSKQSITELQKLLNDANAAEVYGNQTQARELLTTLNNKLAEPAAKNDPNLQTLRKEAETLTAKLIKQKTVSAENLGSLSSAEKLIVLPNYLATETNRAIVSYNRTNKQIQDGNLKISEPISKVGFVKNNLAVIYTNSELRVWNFQSSLLSPAYATNLPATENLAALIGYPSNGKVYILDNKLGKVTNYQVSDKGLANPTASIAENSELVGASSLAIDSNIYVLNSGKILKFQSGQKQEFNTDLIVNLSNDSLIYTENGFQHLYVLDKQAKKIYIIDKAGKLIQTLASEGITNPKDFTVDEKNKAIYLLNDINLLKLPL